LASVHIVFSGPAGLMKSAIRYARFEYLDPRPGPTLGPVRPSARSDRPSVRSDRPSVDDITAARSLSGRDSGKRLGRAPPEPPRPPLGPRPLEGLENGRRPVPVGITANFVSHLEKRDEVDGTSHADVWRKGLIHGPRAPFTVPYEPTDGGGEPDAEGGAMEAEIEAPADGQRDTAIALAAARTAATAVANVLGAARERDHLAAAQTALAVAAPRPDD
jgi:hypothetical protein